MRRLLILILLLLSSSVYAQNASSREWTIFRKGVGEYQKGNYEMARQSFSLMLSKLPNSALTTANHLMLAKTLYKMERYQDALEHSANFLRDFPKSSYRDDIIYLQGNIYYRMDRLERAVLQWLQAAFDSDDERLRQNALQHADAAIRHKIKRNRVQELASQYSGTPTGAAFRYHLALNDKERGQTQSANNTFKLIVATPNSGIYGERAKAMLDGTVIENNTSTFSGQPAIAALMPLSGSHADVGQTMLNGIELALNDYNAEASQKLELKSFDYETRLIPALKQMRAIAADPSVIAVIGPLENDIAAACAALADHLDIALISPTASSDEILELSENTFLLAPTVDAMASRLGHYAFDSLAVKHAASLSPIDDYYVKMVETFAKQATADSASLLAQEWYYPGDQDFKKQFMQLKRIGLREQFRDSVKQETYIESEAMLDSMYSAWQEAERERMEENDTKIDSVDIPVTAFGALFLPVFADDISLIAAQLAFSNIQAQILGNSDWYDAELLRRNRSYLDGMVFVSDGYLNEESWEYKQFLNNYRTTYKTTPDRFALVGFDSFNFIARALEGAQKLNRQTLPGLLVDAGRYTGVYRRFAVGAKRFNNASLLLRYKFGQIIPLQ